MPKWRHWSYGITTTTPSDKMDFKDTTPIDKFKEWIQQRSTDHRFRRIQNLLFGFETFMAFILLICLSIAYFSAQFDVFPSVYSCSTY